MRSKSHLENIRWSRWFCKRSFWVLYLIVYKVWRNCANFSHKIKWKMSENNSERTFSKRSWNKIELKESRCRWFASIQFMCTYISGINEKLTWPEFDFIDDAHKRFFNFMERIVCMKANMIRKKPKKVQEWIEMNLNVMGEREDATGKRGKLFLNKK